jgi:hypothetical protein
MVRSAQGCSQVMEVFEELSLTYMFFYPEEDTRTLRKEADFMNPLLQGRKKYEVTPDSLSLLGILDGDLMVEGVHLCEEKQHGLFYDVIDTRRRNKVLPIKEGTFIRFVVGKVQFETLKSSYEIMVAVSKNPDDPAIVTDSMFQGNETRFLNHSHSPNVEYCLARFQDTRNGLLPCVVAIQDISCGEELTVDYLYVITSLVSEIPIDKCDCAAQYCPGYIGTRQYIYNDSKGSLSTSFADFIRATSIYAHVTSFIYPFPDIQVTLKGLNDSRNKTVMFGHCTKEDVSIYNGASADLAEDLELEDFVNPHLKKLAWVTRMNFVRGRAYYFDTDKLFQDGYFVNGPHAKYMTYIKNRVSRTTNPTLVTYIATLSHKKKGSFMMFNFVLPMSILFDGAKCPFLKENVAGLYRKEVKDYMAGWDHMLENPCPYFMLCGTILMLPSSSYARYVLDPALLTTNKWDENQIHALDRSKILRATNPEFRCCPSDVYVLMGSVTELHWHKIQKSTIREPPSPSAIQHLSLVFVRKEDLEAQSCWFESSTPTDGRKRNRAKVAEAEADFEASAAASAEVVDLDNEEEYHPNRRLRKSTARNGPATTPATPKKKATGTTGRGAGVADTPITPPIANPKKKATGTTKNKDKNTPRKGAGVADATETSPPAKKIRLTRNARGGKNDDSAENPGENTNPTMDAMAPLLRAKEEMISSLQEQLLDVRKDMKCIKKDHEEKIKDMKFEKDAEVTAMKREVQEMKNEKDAEVVAMKRELQQMKNEKDAEVAAMKLDLQERISELKTIHKEQLDRTDSMMAKMNSAAPSLSFGSNARMVSALNAEIISLQQDLKSARVQSMEG